VAELRPFEGYRYVLKAPGDLGRLVSPPYDMIDKAMVDRLYDTDAHNIVRIIQNRKEATDGSNRDRHLRAAALLDQWIKAGVIARDQAPSLYVYQQEFSIPQGAQTVSYRRTAVISLVSLVDYAEGVVFPHENTLSGPKADRYELLQAVRTHAELIFGIVPDDGGLFSTICSCAAGAGTPVGVFDTDEGVHHTLYRTDNTAAIQSLLSSVKKSTILIADGHHRYETALKFFRDTKNPQFGYAVMALVSSADPGLVIRPFHRVIRSSPGTVSVPLHEALAEYFDKKDLGPAELSQVSAFLDGRTDHEMLFVDSTTRHLYGLRLSKGGDRFISDNLSGMSRAWNRLDVSKINSIVVKKILGLPLDGTVLHDLIDYVNNAGAAFDAAMAGGVRGAFFIKPIDMATVNSIVSTGERMPQKSTNFFPKFYSGLVFYRPENA
jgi:uncharacterized protein (DUF1015 family)